MSVVTAWLRPHARRLPGATSRRTPATLPFYVVLVLLLVFSLAPLLVFVGNAFKTQPRSARTRWDGRRASASTTSRRRGRWAAWARGCATA